MPLPIRIATNLKVPQLALLTEALGAAPETSSYEQADLIVLEARGGHEELTDVQADAIVARVRSGATLLLSLDDAPQLTSIRLGFALPAVTWQAAARRRDWPSTGSVTVASADRSLFQANDPTGRVLPYYLPIQILSADERGQSTYSAYARNTPFTGRPVPPGDELWTRPLALRDIRVHLTADDNQQTPLLSSARYGAGRSMLFASGFDELTASPSILPNLMAFLSPRTVSPPPVPPPAPTLEISYGLRSILLSLASTAPASVEIVARVYTSQGAPLGAMHDFHQPVVLLPGKPTLLEMPLPATSLTGFEELTVRDAFVVRIAVLANSGATTLLCRQVLADFSPALSLDLMADDINHWAYPFHAPGPSLQRSFGDRSAAQIGAYVYPPGSRVSATLTLTNGLRDLGPLAIVADSAAVVPLDSSNKPVTISAASSLIDGSMVAHKRPLDSIAAQSFWLGRANIENTLTFTFPHAVTLASISLCGDWRMKPDTNPDVVLVQVDGRKLISVDNLSAQFVAQSGLAHIEFSPTTGTVFTLKFPPRTDAKVRNVPIQLTQIRFEGWTGKAPETIPSNLRVSLENSLTGAAQELSNHFIALAPGERRRIPISVSLPAGSGAPNFYRIVATFADETTSLPLMSLQPARPLRPYADLVDPDAPSQGFIVTAGFRSCFPLGTGTAEHAPGSWANPDDLIWAYSRMMKEVGRSARTQANRLYVADTDMRHYAAPWRPFNNGALLYAEAAPSLLAGFRAMHNYKDAPTVHFGHSDRWDTGPHMDTLHSWQDFVEFDRHLRESGRPGLTGKTRQQIADEIHDQHEDAWQAYQLNLYLTNLRTIRDAFATDGKRLLITAQGVPTVAGPAGAELGETFQAMSDDHSWGMAEGSVSLTTGRQMGELAHNPVWKMSTLIQYGYTNGPLNNSEWHSPPGTLEPTRREYYDRAWRATVWPDGRYGSVYTAGYNENAGISYRMVQEDFRQWFRIEELHSLLSPEEPLGAGIVLSTSRFSDPAHTRFTADGNLFNASPDGYALARVFQRLTDAGLSLPFGANISALAKWQGSAPLLVLHPEVYSPEELATLEHLQSRGVRMAAISGAALSARVAALFSHPGSVVSLDPTTITPAQARSLVDQLQAVLAPPLVLPAHTRGYGFRQQGLNFVVAQNWQDAWTGQGLLAHARLRATPGKTTAQACAVNDHSRLQVTRSGADWIIEFPLRPGDGQLIALRET